MSESTKQYFERVNKVVSDLQDLPDDKYAILLQKNAVVFGWTEEGRLNRVQWSKEVYIEHLKRELDSTWKLLTGGGPKGLKSAARSRVLLNTQVYDRTAIFAHGILTKIPRGKRHESEDKDFGDEIESPEEKAEREAVWLGRWKPSGKIRVTGVYVEQKEFLKELRAIGEPLGGKPRYVVGSCFEKGRKTMYYTTHDGVGVVIPPPHRKCGVRFFPIDIKVHDREVTDLRPHVRGTRYDPNPSEAGKEGKE